LFLLFPGISAASEQLARLVARVSCLGKAEKRVRPDRQGASDAAEPIVETPMLAAALHDKKVEAMIVAQLVATASRLCVAHGEIGEM
jgi:hypothetical protein